MKIFLLSIFLWSNLVYSQSILMTINKDTIYTSDFEKKQQKSLKLLGTKETINNYVDFILLKQYAIKKDVYNSPGYQMLLTREGEKLRDSLYYPSEELEPLLQDYYSKIQIEKKIQFLHFKKGVLPSDQTAKENFIKSVIQDINSKKITFEQAVEKYSSILDYKKPTYLNIFALDKYLIDAIYKIPLNKITIIDLFDHQQYFLILVTKERKYLGEVYLEKILIKDTSSKGESQAQNIYNQLKEGKDFEKLKAKYTQESKGLQEKKDYNPLMNDTLYRYAAKVIQTKTLEDTVFPPIKTDEGYEVYKYFFSEDYSNYGVAKKKMYIKLKRSPEIEVLNNNLLEELRNQTFFKENIKEFEAFLKSLPKTYGEFLKMNVKTEITLASVGKLYKLTNKELLDQLKKVKEKDYKSIRDITNSIFNNWENNNLLQYYKSNFSQLERNKDSWTDLIDKLLIQSAFGIIAEEAEKDTQGQKKFLEKEASNLTWKERVQGTFYYCLDEEVQNQVSKMLKEKRSEDYIKGYFKNKTNKANIPLLVVDDGKFTREELNLPKDITLTPKLYETKSKNRFLIADIKKVLYNDRMTLEELQTFYIDRYVDYRTNETLKALRNKAVIKMNDSEKLALEKKYGS